MVLSTVLHYVKTKIGKNNAEKYTFVLSILYRNAFSNGILFPTSLMGFPRKLSARYLTEEISFTKFRAPENIIDIGEIKFFVEILISFQFS